MKSTARRGPVESARWARARTQGRVEPMGTAPARAEAEGGPGSDRGWGRKGEREEVAPCVSRRPTASVVAAKASVLERLSVRAGRSAFAWTTGLQGTAVPAKVPRRGRSIRAIGRHRWPALRRVRGTARDRRLRRVSGRWHRTESQAQSFAPTQRTRSWNEGSSTWRKSDRAIRRARRMSLAAVRLAMARSKA
jgi:hypothetical protein